MDDIKRQDRRILVKELFRPTRLFALNFFAFCVFGLMAVVNREAPIPFEGWMTVAAIFAGAHFLVSYRAALKRRFLSRRFEALWNGCVDRLKLFDEVRDRMARDKMHDWQEMPRTVERVAKALYLALRRADIISHEVTQTEKGLYNQPPPWVAPSHDPQAKELYRIADKNIAEYRAHYGAVMAGVQRTEAQCAVFMTTVDTLRMRMIGYRLVGRSPEMSSQDFLEAMTEAKLQLASIDKALEELELGPFPKMIAVMPPPLPEDVQKRIEEGAE
jgi:hypothetical protein